MFAPTVISLFEEALHRIKNDEGNTLAVNPGVIFDQKLKNGELSHLKDSEYNDCCNDMNELNLHIWNEASSMTWGHVFLNAIRYIISLFLNM